MPVAKIPDDSPIGHEIPNDAFGVGDLQSVPNHSFDNSVQKDLERY